MPSPREEQPPWDDDAEVETGRVPNDEADPLCAMHELRPERLLTIVDDLKAMTADVPDPSARQIYAVPNHWSAFWMIPNAGFLAAQQELGFSGEFSPACDSTEGDAICSEKQVTHFEELTDGDPSNGEAEALAISVKSSEAMQAPLLATGSRLPIITFDSDANEESRGARQMYLGALNIPAGQSAGFTLLENVDRGTIRMFASTHEAPNLVERAAGAFSACLGEGFVSAEAFRASQYCAELATTHRCEADCMLAPVHMTVEFYSEQFEADADFIAGHPDADLNAYMEYLLETWLTSADPPRGLLSLHGTPSSIAEQAVANHGTPGRIHLVTWDFSPEVQTGLAAGTIEATMVQNAYFYGYLSAHVAYAMAVAGNEAVHEVLDPFYFVASADRLLDTGMTIVTADNLDSYLEYEESCLQ